MAPLNYFRKVDFWIAVCFTLNYIVGSGFLTLPYAFYEAGWILSLVSLLLLAILAILAVVFILEAGERAKLLKRRIQLGNSSTSVHDYQAITSEMDINIVENGDSTLMYQNSGKESGISGLDLLYPGHVFELPELCEFFLGSVGKRAYLALVTVYLYGVLWAYCTVFASAFATHLPYFSYYPADFDLYLSVFAIFVIPMSLLELSEQVAVQVTLTIFRVVMLTIMISTVVSSYLSGEKEFGSLSHVHAKSAGNIEKVPQLLSIAAYAFIIHHSTPALAQQVKNKRSLVAMFSFSLGFCFVAYSLIGSILSMYFGSKILPSSNLCWEHYVGILNKDGSRPLYAQLVSHFVVLFPALDVASAFPLNAYTLGNNIMSGYHSTTYSTGMDEINRWEVSKFRLVAAVPPFFLASLKVPLNEITSYSGLNAFCIMFIVPALLAHYSEKRLDAIGAPKDTLYSSVLTSKWSQCLVGMCGAGLLMVSLISLLV